MKSLRRISAPCDPEGLGGERSSGRWHTAARGKRIVHLSEHLALVEVLVNLRGDPRLFPDRYQLMKVVVPDDVRPDILPPGTLSSDWRNDPAMTRAAGDSWLKERSAALLAVPSAPSPESTNYLLNPLHQDSRRISVEWCRWIEYDKRLFH